jgi:flagellar motor switch protein FliG
MAEPALAQHKPGLGRSRVAALLLTMGKPLADKILQYFEEEEVQAIAAATATLGAVSRQTIESLVVEISEALEAGGEVHGSWNEVQKLLSGVVPPEKLAVIMAGLRKDDGKSVWTRLSDLPEPTITQYLLREHPQVAAFVLSRAAGSISAAVLRQAPGPMRSEIVRRIIAMRPTTETAVRLLDKALCEELLVKVTRDSGPPVHARVADIINKMDRQHMDEVLSDLENRRPKDAKLVKGLLFTFDDIVKLSVADRVKLFDGVPVERIILALHGAGLEMRELVLASISTRSRRMVEQELTSGAAPPAREINKAKRAIADLVLEMAERGLIDIAQQSASDDEAP